ncbi:SGNH/GDSL hydrolase family protein [Algoriphagus lacus]|nr:SGNH/GDSL hydrolase family protein [Algoriphagus lacus]
MAKILWSFLIFFGIHHSIFSQVYSIPKDTKRIVFLGNSITYNGKFVTYIDAYLTLRYPEKNLEIINVGLPSETVSGLSEQGHADGKFPRPDLRERLDRVLKQLEPDLVIANYGMNDGIYLPFDEERFEAFKKGMSWMHQTVEFSGAEIIHVTPPVYDERKGAAYSNVLDMYSDWLVSRRYTQNWKVIDLHWPMRKGLEDRRSLNPEFAFAKDGIHPDESGHFLMAKILLLGLGEEVKEAYSIEELLAPFPMGMQVLPLIEQRQEIQKLAWLSATGHIRPGIPEGLSIKLAQEKVAAINLEIRTVLGN